MVMCVIKVQVLTSFFKTIVDPLVTITHRELIHGSEMNVCHYSLCSCIESLSNVLFYIFLK